MSLAAGARLGPYEIVAAIGAGGMGEVYRARDTRLQRDVAVKVLPAHLASDPIALGRFEREATAVAALSHPHILAIHDVGREGNTSYAVMELLDGETLRERLDKGALAPRKAIDMAIQIARGLAAAHSRGIVHRDLKPENVFVGTDGHVKVLDFGLAKVEEPAGLAATMQATAAVVPATRPGTVLGTVGYMSPEQVRGISADHRTDIFSLGVMLHEMLSGRRPFARETQAETMTAILKDDPPDLSASGVHIAPTVDRLIRRCLEKSPSERFHSAHDLALALETLSGDSGAAPEVAARGHGSARDRYLPWIVAVLALTAGAWAWWNAFRPPPPPPIQTTRASIDLPAGTSMWLGRGSSVALSPAGDRVAYSATADGVTRLYVRALNRFESLALPGTEGAANPFFSPDGQWLGFTAQGKLKKIAVDGGRAITICDTPNLRGEAWAADDSILLTPNGATGLWRVSSAGGTPVQVTRPAQGELSHRWPQLLPDGRTVIYNVWNDSGFDGGRIAVQTLGSNDQRVLVSGGGYGRVVPLDDRRAYLLYARSDGVLAAPFDLSTLAITGPAIPVLDGVITNLSGGAHYSVSRDGTLAYLPGALDEVDKVLLAVDRTGRAEEIARIKGLSFAYRLSPDGRRLVRVNTQGTDRDVWIDDLQRGTATRVTFGGHHFSPVWTPDGRRVIYSSGLPSFTLFWKAADGSGSEEPLTTGTTPQLAGSVSPDGRMLGYIEFDPERAADIWVMPLDGDRTPRPFLQTPFSEGTPMISPDGRWLAYQSNETGRFEIYIAPFPEGGAKFQVSTNGGFDPVWRRDGRELFFRYDDRVEAVDVADTSQLSTSAPKTLFRGVFQGDGDVTPDGKLVLIKPTDQESAPRTIALVVKWVHELRTKVPVK